MRILMVLTSHNRLGDTGQQTGLWLEEFAAPYYLFQQASAHITLASPAGGYPPIDPNSDVPDAQTDYTEKLKHDSEAQTRLANTSKLAEITAQDFDAVFYPGGHGPLWDLADDPASISLIETMHVAGKPVALVCHAPGVLRHTKTADAMPLLKGKGVTGFSNGEENAAGLSDVVPFLVEDALKDSGATYHKAEDGQSFAVIDGNLITGQNPASSAVTAKALLELLGDTTNSTADDRLVKIVPARVGSGAPHPSI